MQRRFALSFSILIAFSLVLGLVAYMSSTAVAAEQPDLGLKRLAVKAFGKTLAAEPVVVETVADAAPAAPVVIQPPEDAYLDPAKLAEMDEHRDPPWIEAGKHPERAKDANRVWESQPVNTDRARIFTPPPAPLQEQNVLGNMPLATYTMTLETVHQNTNDNGAMSSVFVFTNTGTSAADYMLEFQWPNGDHYAWDGPYNLNGGGSMTYDMDAPGIGGDNFLGKVIISSDESIDGRITTPDYGIISGYVYEDDGTTPLQNAWAGVEDFYNGWGYGGSGITSDGSYYVGGLPDGDYRVSTHPNYPWASQWYDGHEYGDNSDMVTVSGANHVTDINFVVQPGGMITGTVYGPDGTTPLENIHVDIHWHGACTDANGYYELQGVPYGNDHRVYAGGICGQETSPYVGEYYDDQLRWDDAALLTVDAGQDIVTDIDFVLAMGGVITGRVTSEATGQPLSGAWVHADEYDDSSYGQGAESDANGYYEITGLPDGDYRVSIHQDGAPAGYASEFYNDTLRHDDADRINLNNGNTVTDINFALGPGGSVSGRITDQHTGQPIANMKVEVHGDGHGYGTCTDSNGEYTLPGLPYGDYQGAASRGYNWCTNQPNVYAQEWYQEKPFNRESDWITVDAGTPDHYGIDYTLEEGGSIAGTIFDESQGDAPIPNLRVELWIEGDHPHWGWVLSGVDTDNNGSYLFDGLPSGDYVIYAWTAGNGQLLVSEFYNDAFGFTEADWVHVNAGQAVEDIDLYLDTGVWITGTVTVPPGYSAEGIGVDVWKWDGMQYNEYRETDANGDYIIPVPPIYDSYWAVRAMPRGTDLGGQWAHGFDLSQQSQWDFDLTLGGTIRGRITDRDTGQPVSDFHLSADSNWMGEGTRTDSDGYYEINNLPVGAYRMQTEGDSYLWTYYGGHDWDYADLVPVYAGQATDGIDIEAVPAGEIEGYVYAEDGTTPLEGIRVTAHNDQGYWEGWSHVDGSFHLDVPAGDHVLFFEDKTNWMMAPTFYPGVSKFSDATTVTVPPLDATLQVNQNMQTSAQLHGQVTEAGTGSPLGGILISVLHVDPVVDREAYWSQCTDENGEYHIDGIWPGEVEITVSDTCGNLGSETIVDTLVAQPAGDYNRNYALGPGPMPDWPFTVWTEDGGDYTPLNAGNWSDTTGASSQIVAALFEPLVGMDSDGNWYSEMLVQVPTVDNGGAGQVGDQFVVTYELKPGLLWSDGAPLTSADIRFTWEMLTRPFPNPASNTGNLVWKIADVATPDPLTAVVTFQPGVIPPDYLGAINYLLPEHVLAGEHPLDLLGWSEFAHNPVGNGPYVVADWLPGGYLDLVPNANYHRRSAGFPVIQEVRFLFTMHAYYGLRYGVIDASLNIPMWQGFDFHGWGDLQVYTGTNGGFDSIYLNPESVFFDDPEVRSALYQALNRQQFVEHPVNGMGRIVGDVYVPPDNAYYSDAITYYDFNLVDAAAKLGNAGWVDTNGNGTRDKNGVEFEFDLYYHDGHDERAELATMFQQDLAAIGVNANVIPENSWEVYDRGRRGEFDAFTLGWLTGPLMGSAGYDFWHSSQIPTAYNTYQTYNLSRWADPAMDAIALALKTEVNEADKKDLYAQQQQLITDQVPVWTHSHWARYNAAVPTLLNFEPTMLIPATWNIEEWELPDNPYDLAVRKRLAPNSNSPQPGKVIRYEIDIWNAGYFTMTNAVLRDILPAGVSYVGANPVPDQISGDILTWNLGDIPGNSAPLTIIVQVRVLAASIHGTVLTNEVEVYADETDTHPENNAFVHIIEVREDVDLAVSKSGIGQPAVGEKFQYFIDYANWGGAPASGVVVTDTLPAEVTLVSANPAPDSQVGQLLTWNLGDLAGSQWGGQIEMTVDIINPGTVVNLAGVSGTESETDYTNNLDDHTDLVDEILAPVILKPTQGTTDGTPTISGLAPSGADVEIYSLTLLNSTPTLIATTKAKADGTFSVELNLQEGTFILQAQSKKSGLTSGWSNTTTFDVDHDLPLDPDYVVIQTDGVDFSAGCVRADRYTLARRQLTISAILDCPTMPNAHLEVTENGLITYNVPPTSTVSTGGNQWQVDFRLWMAEPHSTYDVWLKWDCNGVPKKVLLMYILIDPYGFVYDQSLVDAGSVITDSLILDAEVTAYVKKGENWEVWPAYAYNQTNPQTTDSTTDDGVIVAGYYSFLTPPGQYRITATAPGYQPYQSEVITVINTVIRNDIGMQPVNNDAGFNRSPADFSRSVKLVDKNEAWVGNKLTYEIYLRNDGEEDSGMLDLSDTLPAHTKYVNNSLALEGAGSAGYDAASQTIWWTGVLSGEHEVKLTYQLSVISSPGAPFEVANQAQVTGADTNLASVPELSASTKIQNAPDVELEPPRTGQGKFGDQITYSHTITNTGNRRDTFNFSAVSSLGLGLAVPDPVTLTPGESTTVQFVVTLTGSGIVSGMEDTTTLTATSAMAPTITASVEDKTTVTIDVYKLYLPLVYK